MAVKSSGTGAFLIPTAPAVGTTVAGGAANTFTTNAVQLIASTSAAIFITGLHVQLSSTSQPTYVVIRLSTGAGDGSIVGEFIVPYAYTAGATGTQVSGYVKIDPWIPVAASTRIGAKSADSVGSLSHTVILQCINQMNVVAEGSINETVNVIQVNGTTQTAGDIIADTNDIQSRIPAALSGDGFIKADLKSIEDELTSGNNAILKLKQLDVNNSSGDAVKFQGTSSGLLIAASDMDVSAMQIYATSSGSWAVDIYGDTGGIVATTLTGGSIIAPNGITGSDSEDLSVTNITDKIWDEATAGHATAGTTGKSLTDAGSVGDPWTTTIPGAYGAGTAGYILGNNIDATVSSRSSHSVADIWSAGTRTLTSFGSLIADIWANVTRTITGGTIDTNNDKTGYTASTVSDKTGYALISAYDAAKTAATQTSVDDLPTNAELATALDAIPTAAENAAEVLSQAAVNPIDANVQEVNDVPLTGDGSTTPWGPA